MASNPPLTGEMTADGAIPKRGHGDHSPRRWVHWLLVPLMLALCGGLAVRSLLRDSVTFDETAKLAAGMSPLKFGDYRLCMEHPPLAMMWAALPLVWVEHAWPPPTVLAWQDANEWEMGRLWLFRLNSPDRLMTPARSMMVVLLLGVCLVIYGAARRLFGPGGGLPALAAAVLCPTLLAHGRLVGNDVPVVLAALGTLLAFAWLLDRVTIWRFLATAGALGALSVIKFSWPLILPALGAMGIVALVRKAPLNVSLGLGSRASLPQRLVAGRGRRLLLLAGVTLALALSSWAAIWSTYGWQRGIFAEASGDASTAHDQARLVRLLEDGWRKELYDEEGAPRGGVVRAFARLARSWHLLPDSYLMGLILVRDYTSERAAYLCGEYSPTGFWWYFPIAFALKTPVATLLLMLLGLAGLIAARGVWREQPVLIAGLLAFAVVYGIFVMNAALNIGVRHFLPVHAVLLIFCGGAIYWGRFIVGKVALTGLLLWLGISIAMAHPQYLSYFNLLAGGAERGHLFLADSNLDWGQDLKRLAAYQQAHREKPLKLAYFGTAVPEAYGITASMLPSIYPAGSISNLQGEGLYVISATLWLGVYAPLARDEYWESAEHRAEYRELAAALAEAGGADPRDARRRARYDRLRWGRFLARLRQQAPDARIGHSLFAYDLSAEEVEALVRPE